MKVSKIKNYPIGLSQSAKMRFKKMAKTDMLMRVTQEFPDIRRGYIEFKNGIYNDGSEFIELTLTILEKEN